MPIKVRCGECQTVLNLPDAAAGKVAKCRNCGGRVRVPAGGATQRPKRQAAEAAERDESPEDALAGLDLRSAEDKKRKVCPGCASPVRADDIECPKCGVTIATGTLSARQRLLRERKGPPPAEFYGQVWGNGWKFLKKHWGYGIRTAAIWTLTLSMSISCVYAWVWYINGRTAELTEMSQQQGIQVAGAWMYITPPKDGKIEYDGKTYREPVTLRAPRVSAMQSPPSYFWAGMAIVFQLGFGGWAWMLATKIIDVTMSGEKKIKRFHFDFFGNLTMGFRFYFWPIILMVPVFWIGPLLLGLQVVPVIPGAIITAVIALIPIFLFLPSAAVHMAQKYQYRAWLLTWMARDFAATIAPTLYVGGMLFFLVLLLPLGCVGAAAATWPQLEPFLRTQLENACSAISPFDPGNMRFLFIELPVVFGAAFAVFFVLCSLTAFPAVFMMRVLGLFGLYFRPDLALVNEFPDLEPAGFGPRYLAYLIDNIIMSLFFMAAAVAARLLQPLYFMYGVPDDYALAVTGALTSLGGLVMSAMYFARGESGAARATLGKWSIGLVVMSEDNKPISRKLGYKRAIAAGLMNIPLYVSFLTCVFRPDKRALHDVATKTRVAWRGEEL